MVNSGQKILVVEDEPDIRKLIQYNLAQERFRVLEAEDGEQALKIVQRDKPNLLILDLMLPGLSGIEAAHHIGRRAHLVFVTAHDHYAVEAFAQGVLDYLVKPVDQARLAETVARLKDRLQAAQPALNTEALLQQLAAQLTQLQMGAAPAPLRWVRRSDRPCA